MIVLDTTVLSELMRGAPADAVTRWFAGQPAAALYTTAITECEILLGIQLLPAGKRRRALESAAAAMFQEDFAGRVLPFARDAARRYADIAAARQRAGHPIAAFDAQIAAITQAAGATLATRNLADFESCGIKLVDPWRG